MLGKTLVKMGSEVTSVVKNKVLPSVEEALVDLSNDAVPVINDGIDIASEGIERSSDVLSSITINGAKSIGLRVLGKQRFKKLNTLVNNLSRKFNFSVNSLTNTLVKLVEPSTKSNNEYQKPSNHPRSLTDYYQYYFYYDDYSTNPDYYYVDDYTYQDDSKLSSDNKGLTTVVQNTAYVLSSNILGKNLTHAVAPLARSVTQTVSDNLPVFPFRNRGGSVLGGEDDSSIQKRQNEEEKECTTPLGQRGYCKDLSDCPDLILDLTNLRRSICFKGLFVPGVCCPGSALR